MLFGLSGCTNKPAKQKELREKIQSNEYFKFTKEKALEVVKAGFNN